MTRHFDNPIQFYTNLTRLYKATGPFYGRGRRFRETVRNGYAGVSSRYGSYYGNCKYNHAINEAPGAGLADSISVQLNKRLRQYHSVGYVAMG